MNFKEIYFKYIDIFKDKIKDEFIEDLFNKDKKKRISLKTEHTKSNQEPEALTSDIIKEMLRECGIAPLDISREFIISGKDKSVIKKIKKKPDFYIESEDEESNRHLLFEIESLNKNLMQEGDGEGVEQANEWYNIKKTLFLQYNSIITNFMEWYILYYDFETENLELTQKSPWDMLAIIADVKFSRGKEYNLKANEHKREITTKFYNSFQDRLNKLLKRSSNITIPIEIRNYKKPLNLSQEGYEQNQVNYYRTIFSRLLFIKILESWRVLPLDPLNEGILNGEKMHWANDLSVLFFEVFNKKDENRPKEISKNFKKLPYLNGGLFRPSGIELDKSGNLRDIYLNPDAIKDIWDFFNEYRFVEDDSVSESEDSNTINPEILGYIFERSIGEERKKTGSYYTPEEITDYIIENTLFPYIIEKINIYLKKLKIKTIEKFSEIDFLENSVEIYEYTLNNILTNIRICDPACGSGAFLKKSAEKLLFLYKKCYKGCGRILPFKLVEKADSGLPFSDLYSLKEHILQNNLYGVDINPSAVELCELRLWLWVIKPPKEVIDTSPTFTCPPLPNIEYNIRIGNSLVGYTEIPRSMKKTDLIEKVVFEDLHREKKRLIALYYEGTENKEETEINKIKREIDEIIKTYQKKLNKILITEYQKELDIDIPIPSINILDYLEDSKINIKKLRESISELNKKFKLTNFKINCKETCNIDPEDIRKLKGLTCSKRKNTNRVKTIYPTSSFVISYYSESRKEVKRRLSEFIISLISKEDWLDIENIEFERKPDLIDLQFFIPFHWFVEFTDVFEEGGFDIIIGNPPYGGNVLKLEIEINKRIEISKPNIAKIFMLRVDDLIKKNGYISLLAPKSLTYASDWLNLRKNIIDELIEIYDVKEAFRDVLLEQVFYILKKNSKNPDYKAKDFYSDSIPIKINKSIITDTLYCDLISNDFDVISKISKEQYLTDLIKTYRGLPLQKFISEDSERSCLEGRNIGLYKFKGTYRKFNLNMKMSKKLRKKADQLKKVIKDYAKEKIVFQNIVAFIKNPTPHIRVMGSYDTEKLIPTDTVNIIEVIEEKSKFFILGFMNSVLFSWLLHRLAYNKAVRTMHLDNYALSKIPIPLLKSEIVENISQIVEKMLDSEFNINDYIKIEENLLTLYSLSNDDLPEDYQILVEFYKKKF